MPSKAQVRRARDSSPDLPLAQQYNKRGRPIRRGAGKKKSESGYVDSGIIEDDEPIDVPSEDDDGIIIKPVRARKRLKRTPSPTPPPLDPLIYDEDADEISDAEDRPAFGRNSPEPEIKLQFNIPLGFHGPLIVKLDKHMLGSPENVPHNMVPLRRPGDSKIATPVPPARCTKQTAGTGFSDLPPELRNKIYRNLFVAEEDLRFDNPDNFCRSAQFLRTCRMVFSEGCSVLYGENRFVFTRNRHQPALFYQAQLQEIGYKDVRRFLKMIGPENLVYIRDVKITFEDAPPAATPYLPDHESRRYLNDLHLIDCLRILRGARLRKLDMSFHGRRTLMMTDHRFLSYLERIKVDEVVSTEHARWYPNKINDDVLKELKERMTRKKKLYSEKK